jgi:Ca-activated chloride channel family protein
MSKPNLFYRFFMIYFTFTLLVGCSSTTQESGEKKTTPQKYGEIMAPISPESEKKWRDLEKQFLRYPGKFSGEKYDESLVNKELDTWSLNWTEDEYVKKLYYLFTEDYRPIINRFNTLSTKVKVERTGVKEEIQLPESKKVHFSILLDASGSMNQKINGKRKIDIAKEAVKNFASGLPKNAEISLRIYGNKGNSIAGNKAQSCNSTAEMYASKGYNEKVFQTALNKVPASGWTPIAKAIQSVKQDTNSETTESFVYVVSDGEETCGGDPAKEATQLNKSSFQTIVNVIGFDVNDKRQQQLKEVASAGKGSYTSVKDEKAMNQFLDTEYEKLKEQWKKWMEDKVNAADQQTNDISLEIDKIKDDMDDLKKIDKKHFQDAQTYLIRRLGGDIPSDHPLKTMSVLYNDRFQVINGYGWERATVLRNEVVDNKIQERDTIQKEGSKGILNNSTAN